MTLSLQQFPTGLISCDSDAVMQWLTAKTTISPDLLHRRCEVTVPSRAHFTAISGAHLTGGERTPSLPTERLNCCAVAACTWINPALVLQQCGVKPGKERGELGSVSWILVAHNSGAAAWPAPAGAGSLVHPEPQGRMVAAAASLQGKASRNLTLLHAASRRTLRICPASSGLPIVHASEIWQNTPKANSCWTPSLLPPSIYIMVWFRGRIWNCFCEGPEWRDWAERCRQSHSPLCRVTGASSGLEAAGYQLTGLPAGILQAELPAEAASPDAAVPLWSWGSPQASGAAPEQALGSRSRPVLYPSLPAGLSTNPWSDVSSCVPLLIPNSLLNAIQMSSLAWVMCAAAALTIWSPVQQASLKRAQNRFR